MFLELHLVQNFAPHCLNRDETNAPKDCEFGGYRRARISSQCLKRAIRTNPAFSDVLKSGIGVRTKLINKLIADRLIEDGVTDEEIAPVLRKFIPEVLGSLDKNDKTKVLFFVSNVEIDGIYSVLKENWSTLAGKIGDEKGLETECAKLAKSFKLGKLSPDIALFGRMMAERSANNIDAASQVAHAISTNRANMEMDFYTAIDDLQPEEETGAGMMGTVEFNSSCFYRYSSVDIPQLLKNLENHSDLAVNTIEAFVKSSIAAIPTGKQNSMAAHNPPSLVLAVFRESGQPLSLANAFSKPVSIFGTEDKELVSESIRRLDSYMGELVKMYGKDGIAFIGACALGDIKCDGIKSIGGEQFETVEQLVSSLRGALNDSVAHAP